MLLFVSVLLFCVLGNVFEPALLLVVDVVNGRGGGVFIPAIAGIDCATEPSLLLGALASNSKEGGIESIL